MNSDGQELVEVARNVIAAELGASNTVSTAELVSTQPAITGGTFVTLTKNGELRGCIGTLVDDRPVAASVLENAKKAAFSDPRFPPVSAGELDEIDIEVSVLTEPQPLLVDDGGGRMRAPDSEAEVVAALKPGVDGVIFQAGSRSATFLPQVWEQLPDPHQFLQHLKAKAGLPPNYWGDDVEIETYQVTAYHENGS
jgi:AmmeMemoRadiSam system protein A